MNPFAGVKCQKLILIAAAICIGTPCTSSAVAVIPDDLSCGTEFNHEASRELNFSKKDLVGNLGYHVFLFFR